MSLKGFHIVFITLAALVSFLFCAWAFFLAPDSAVTPALKAVAGVSGVAGLVLCVYGVWFVRKSRMIIT